jgi:hypothetical protein
MTMKSSRRSFTCTLSILVLLMMPLANLWGRVVF